MSSVAFLDLDGTLIQTAQRHYSLFSEVLAAHGGSTDISAAEFWSDRRQGKSIRQIFPEPISEEATDEWIGRIEDRAYLSQDELVEGAAEAVDLFRTEFDEVVLVTKRQRESNVRWQLENLSLLDFLDNVIVVDPFNDRKGPVLEARGYCSVDSGIFVGDSQGDIRAGNRLGVTTFGVTSGIRSRAILAGSDPDEICPDVTDVAALVKATG